MAEVRGLGKVAALRYGVVRECSARSPDATWRLARWRELREVAAREGRNVVVSMTVRAADDNQLAVWSAGEAQTTGTTLWVAEAAAVQLERVMEPGRTAVAALAEALWVELAGVTGALPGRDGRYAPAVVHDPAIAWWLLTDGDSPVGALATASRRVDQLYVLPAARRQGLAAAVLAEVTAADPGDWQAEVLAANRAGLAFWRAVLRDHEPREMQHGQWVRLSWHVPRRSKEKT